MGTSSQTTEPAFTAPAAHRTSELALVAEALLALSAEFAELPRPYIPVWSSEARFGIQLMHPSHFEAWREALGLSVGSVELKAGGGLVWLAAPGNFRGIAFELTGHSVPLTQKQAETPQVADEASAVAA
ncbi:hypothetical protein AB0M11_08305 [Streptomyces sp. NPDC051987]|uniref:hypothetical protein n=1 Tax=Streptomyces sp. NPDC051987 TaxID=3155808 RepID=UPI00344A73BC